MIKIKFEKETKEEKLQNLYDLFMNEETFNNNVLMFIAYLPIIKKIELICSYTNDYITVTFENEKKLNIYSCYIMNKIYEEYF